MSAQTFEGTVENGQIKLLDGVVLPENTKVYVLVAASAGADVPRLRSPRLVHPQQFQDFQKQVIKTDSDATV